MTPAPTNRPTSAIASLLTTEIDARPALKLEKQTGMSLAELKAQVETVGRFSSERRKYCPFVNQVMLPNRASVTRLWAETLKRPRDWNTAITLVVIGAIIRRAVPGNSGSQNF